MKSILTWQRCRLTAVIAVALLAVACGGGGGTGADAPNATVPGSNTPTTGLPGGSTPTPTPTPTPTTTPTTSTASYKFIDLTAGMDTFITQLNEQGSQGLAYVSQLKILDDSLLGHKYMNMYIKSPNKTDTYAYTYTKITTALNGNFGVANFANFVAELTRQGNLGYQYKLTVPSGLIAEQWPLFVRNIDKPSIYTYQVLEYTSQQQWVDQLNDRGREGYRFLGFGFGTKLSGVYVKDSRHVGTYAYSVMADPVDRAGFEAQLALQGGLGYRYISTGYPLGAVGSGGKFSFIYELDSANNAPITYQVFKNQLVEYKPYVDKYLAESSAAGFYYMADVFVGFIAGNWYSLYSKGEIAANLDRGVVFP
jgi:hypothetical protein